MKQNGNKIKDFSNEIEYKGIKYKLVFNLNVMEEIQEEYGTLDKWGSLTDGSTGEPSAKAVIFGFKAMLNEGIDIMNEENGTDIKSLSLKQVGRLITEVGLLEATKTLNETVVESTKSNDDSKNV